MQKRRQQASSSEIVIGEIRFGSASNLFLTKLLSTCPSYAQAILRSMFLSGLEKSEY